MKEHHYAMTVTWTGNEGKGTATYRDYSRAHDIYVPGKPVLAGSADPAFRGDRTRWNPEELLVASLSECHMLWVLALASMRNVVITGYVDEADGVMVEESGGGGQFREVTLRPVVTVAEPGMVAAAEELHAVAHSKCYIARSVNFPVKHEPRTLT
ncbi:OsmC family protein [Amycolatopsis lurida]